MSISKQFFLKLLPTVLISILLISFVNIYSTYETVTTQIRSHLESVASIQTHRVTSTIEHVKNDLGLISSRTKLRKSLAMYNIKPNIEHLTWMNNIILDAKESTHSINNITILDYRGKAIASTAKSEIGKIYTDLFKTDKPIIMTAEGAISMIFSKKLIYDGNIVGTLLVENSLHNLNSTITDYSGLGSTGETVLAMRDENGDAKFIIPLRFDKDAAMQHTISKERLSVPISQALLKKNLFLDSAPDYRNKNVLAQVRYIEDLDWGIVVKIDEDEAYSPLYKMLYQDAILSLIIIIIMSYILKEFSRSFISPIELLTKKSQEILVKTIPNSKIKTEDIKDEIEVLNINLNILLDRLQEKIKLQQASLKQGETDLQEAQSNVINSKKMASLGEMVAGVAHEINTPVGSSLTGVTHLQDIIKNLRKLYEESNMSEDDFNNFLEIAEKIASALTTNLERTVDLVRSFKQVASDQTSDIVRIFNVKEYINEILISLRNNLKNTKHIISIHCDDNLILKNHPGYFAQILTNFIMNSLIHGLDKNETGHIDIDIKKESNSVTFTYSDDGKGINKEHIDKIFNPFFTTNRDNGGTGLGLNIVHNIVTKNLDGTIECHSELGNGTKFIINFESE